MLQAIKRYRLSKKKTYHDQKSGNNQLKAILWPRGEIGVEMGYEM